MKKFLFITLALAIAATGAWAIKAKIDTTTKAKMQVEAIDKASDTTTPIMALRAMGAKDPEGAVTVPYYNTFDTDAEIAQLSLLDNNQDGSTWGVYTVSNNNVAGYQYNSTNAADDYLFLPPMQLDASLSYKFALDAWARSTTYPERFEVLLLDEASTVVQTVIASTDVTVATPTNYSNDNVTVEETGYYTFAIHAISDADQFYLYVDNVAVTANIDNDLAITLSAPATVKAGQTVTATATVTNVGGNAAPSYMVSIYNGEEPLLNQIVDEELAVGASKTFTVEVPTTVFDAEKVINLTAKVTYEADENEGNNSAAATTTVEASSVNAPETLTAEGAEGGTIELNWTMPEVPEVYTEDFENTDIFPEFSLGGITAEVHNGAIGDWTLYDANGTETYGYNGVTMPNAYQPMAWLVFAPSSPNLSQSLMETQAPHSGVQALASFCIVPPETGGTTDHWLISPELTGEAQTISFYARELTDQYGAETFEVLASSTDNASTSFTLVQSLSSSVTDWAEYTAALPEGTKYFAIRHTSNDIFALFIDDITYKPAAPPTGTVPTAFNIYLDGEFVATVNGDVTTYTIEGVEPGDYVCSVTAVYGDIESTPVSANATVPEETPAPTPVITVDVAFGTYEAAQTVHVTVENMPENGAIKYQLVPSSSKEEWSDYDNATGIAVNESAALTVAVFDANGEELARLEGEYVIDTQTGIANIGVDGYDNNAWYNLNGQKLNGKPVAPGIYINGNKKVIIK